MTRAVVFPVFIPHAGCPFQCVFCNQFAVTAQAAAPTPEQLRVQLDAWLPIHGQGEIAFYGGSFTLLPGSLQHNLLGVAGDFIARGRARGIRLSTRPDGLTTEQLRRLADYPVSTVEVGCQSFSDLVLSASGRGCQVADMVAGVGRLRAIEPWRMGLQLMPGLPGAMPGEALDSLHAALQLSPDFLRIYPTLVLRGTGLEDLFLAGSYHPLPLDEAVELVARMTVRAELAGIPVERSGLQGEPGWGTEQGGLRAGPYHPAFGQLVRSRHWLRVLERLLGSSPAASEIRVPRRLLGDALGQRRVNLDYLKSRFGVAAITASDALDEGGFEINQVIYNWREQLAKTYQDATHEPTC
jgi:histone acetyltransferase (RNA polymerase elongator complex component)